jgi:hypothetical protein
MAHAAGAHASTEASEMLTAAEAADVPAAAKSSPHMAATKAATETSAVTAAATAGLGCAGKQARSKKRCGQYRDCSFHRDSPFRSFRRRFA